jgi:hypothetical protein
VTTSPRSAIAIAPAGGDRPRAFFVETREPIGGRRHWTGAGPLAAPIQGEVVMYRMKFSTVLGTLIAMTGCAVEVADEASIGTVSAPLRGSGGGTKGGKPTATTAFALDDSAFRVEQIEFIDEGGLSAWGRLTVDPAAIVRQTGATAGFVSVRTKLGWVVHNMPVQSRPEADWPERVRRLGLRAPTMVPELRAHFNIGTESAVRALDMVVVFTLEPLSMSRDLRKWERAGLTPINVTVSQETQPKGFAVPPPEGLPPQPPPPPPILAPEPLDPELDVQSWHTVSLPAEDNVQSAENQCGPVAYANALAYLRSTFGLDVPHPHIRGIQGGPSLVGVLDLLSGRPVTDACTGSPIEYCDDGSNGGMFDGLYQYLDNAGLSGDVVLEHQGALGTLPSVCQNTIAQQSPISPAVGDVVTVPWIKSHIDNGDAVLLAFNRLQNTPQGEVVQSGHVVRIYGYSEVNGQDFLLALDDQQQDDQVNGFCAALDGGLTWEAWQVGDSDNDGTLNKGMNNLREITFAMAMGVK